MTTTTNCPHCDEAIRPGDLVSEVTVNGQATHWECALRMVVGGLNHLQGRCTCCGGDLPPDPEGVTVREAARMAAQVFVARNPPASEPQA